MYNFNGFTEKASKAVNLGIESAQSLGHTYIGTEHILLGLLQESSSVAYTALEESGVTFERVENTIKDKIGVGSVTKLTPQDLTPRSKRTLQMAVMIASRIGHNYVGTEHILVALLEDGDSYAVAILREIGVRTEDIMNSITNELGGDNGGYTSQGMDGVSSQGGEKGSTKTLDKFGTDLTEKAKKGEIDPVIGRQKEIDRVIQILSRRTKNNPCLIGEPGVGKTAVAEGLALKIANNEVPEMLKGKRVVALDLTGMIAGTKYRGDFEDRIKGAMDEVKKSGNIILFIDELHTIVGAGSAEGSSDAANILKPSLARGDFQVIGATTINEYRKNIEKDAALERRFQPVMVGEPTQEEAIEILKGLRDRYEAHHKVKITDEAIEQAVKLSSRYITDRYLPDKAIDLIDESASRVHLNQHTEPDDLKKMEKEIERLEKEKSSAVNAQDFELAAKLRDQEKDAREQYMAQQEKWKENRVQGSDEVTGEDIATVVSGWTGVPVVQLTQEESDRLLKMEDVLHQRIIGQDEAVTTIARAIRRGRVGLKDPKRPVGSFIFLGPTGVGKTELCKALAEAMFGNENNMIRLDMSEFMEKHTVSKLVGSPPGYVGYDEGGQLTEKVRRHPYSVILFDEIEKAHPDVFNMLLQILDDGRLTDSQGRTVDFRNTVIIMTSNVGARAITNENPNNLGFAYGDDTKDGQEKMTADKIRETVMEQLKQTFRPEFLNRVDDIIVFNKLNQGEIASIAKGMLETLKKRLADMDVTISFTNEAVRMIAKVGFDPVYGARPLRRAIVSKIEDTLSEKILEGWIKSGDTVVCDYKDDTFVFEK
ncbi:MAG TPA: ATP-dependent Clp protease ATP-binding subunit [Clostridiales bacterium]|nr:ATP-dependent Clp protease ATP-binding subunit [Clostridiales bacterium]